MFKQHLKIHKKMNCELCDKSFTGKDWKVHMIMKHKESCCQYCKKLISLDDLKIHQEQEHHCKLCDKMSKDLSAHMDLHSKEKGLKCQYCGKVYVRSCELQIHIRHSELMGEEVDSGGFYFQGPRVKL